MRIVFIADHFMDDLIGGAELSMQSHIDTCPHEYIKVRCQDLDFKALDNAKDFIILGNFEKMSAENILELLNWNYAFIESDYKYCMLRSSHKHKLATGQECNCHKSISRRLVVDIFIQAKHIFWKSEAQREIYYNLFPKLKIKPSTIISGVFSNEDLEYILSLKDIKKSNEYFILETDSWIKGFPQALTYARENHLSFKLVKNKPYREAVKIMAGCKGLIYLPQGFDTCCRMITEAKLLGLDIRTNDYAQHIKEEWFNAGEEGMLKYLRSRNEAFWKAIGELCQNFAN